MVITGIEVIRGNHGVSADPRVVGVLPGEKLELTYGETLRINTGLEYQGPGQDVRLYGSIGTRGIFGFDEIISNEVMVTLPDSPLEFVPVEASVGLSIAEAIDPGTDYDIYCKIREFPGAGLPEVDDVIDIVGIKPTFDLIHETIYHFAWIYDGETEVTEAEFTTDPFLPSEWVGEKFAEKLEEEVRAEGGRPLEVRVYVDTSPLLWTNFRIEIVSTPIVGIAGASPGVGNPGWIAIILVCLAITAVIVVFTMLIKTVVGIFQHKPDLEQVKPAWGREALMLDIQDAEEYWERTPTPVDELEQMSNQELRDVLDQIAEEEIPPTEGIGMGIVIAGVAVASVAALAIVGMSMGRPAAAVK